MSLRRRGFGEYSWASGIIRYAALMPLPALGVAAAPGCAQAQLVEQYAPDDAPGYAPNFTSSILNQIYYQQDPAGIPLGDYIIRPSLDENAGYDTNTLGNAGSGSSALESNAALRVDSNWARDAVRFSFDADNRKYFNVPSAGYTNFVASSAGVLDLGNDHLKLSYAHSALNIASTDLGIVGITTPVRYAVDDARLAYVAQFSRCNLTPAVAFANSSFGKSSGTANIDYSSLDHDLEVESLAGRCDVTPGDAGIIILRAAQAEFSNAGYQNYDDWGGFAGLDFRGDGILQLRALLGLEQRNFSGAGEKSINLPSFEISVFWAPTGRDSFTATASRRIDDPSSPFALDSTILDGKLVAYHALRANLFVTGSAEVQRSRPAFANSVLNSVNQTQANLGLGLIWDVSAHITASVNYAFNDTASENNPDPMAMTGQYPNFNSHMILIGIHFYE